jgi:hypothetical protein
LEWLKTFGLAKNILRPVKGQGINVLGTTWIWTYQISNICFDFLNCACLKTNNTKYSKFDTSKSMSYQGHSKTSTFCFDCILKRAYSAMITYDLSFGMWLYLNVLPFFRFQHILGWSKLFVSDQKLIDFLCWTKIWFQSNKSSFSASTKLFGGAL